MTDIPAQIVKVPTQGSVGMMAITGIGSASIGDQTGDAIAKIMAWIIAINCNCVPPEAIVSATHTLCVDAVVAIAFFIHYKYLKFHE